jgi:hypothetical protein
MKQKTKQQKGKFIWNSITSYNNNNMKQKTKQQKGKFIWNSITSYNNNNMKRKKKRKVFRVLGFLGKFYHSFSFIVVTIAHNILAMTARYHSNIGNFNTCLSNN